MADVTVALKQLPISHPEKIYVGDDFRGDLITHAQPDGTPIDTSLWTITGAIYERRACGAALIQTLTIEKEPATPWGYRAVLTDAETAALNCGCYWYEITTDDGATVRTYVGGPMTVEGVG